MKDLNTELLHPPRELRLMKIKPRDSREQIRRKPPGSGHLDCQHKEPGTRHSLSSRMPVANSDKRKKKKKEHLSLTQGTTRVAGERECPLETFQCPASLCPGTARAAGRRRAPREGGVTSASHPPSLSQIIISK